MNRPQKVIVHHSASPRRTSIVTIRQWHLERGFDDIGYHAVIEHDGVIRYGRPTWVVGAHDQGENTNSIGVCVTGNNLVPADRWSWEQVCSLVDFLVACKKVYGPMLGIFMHKENEPAGTATDCPGLTQAEWASILIPVGRRTS